MSKKNGPNNRLDNPHDRRVAEADRLCAHCGMPLRNCSECGKRLTHPDAMTCSNACRQHRHQRLKRVDAAVQGRLT